MNAEVIKVADTWGDDSYARPTVGGFEIWCVCKFCGYTLMADEITTEDEARESAIDQALTMLGHIFVEHTEKFLERTA